MELPNFSTVRVDRGTKTSGKQRGGLLIYIYTRGCNFGHMNIKISVCWGDIELLVGNLCPFYLPREFGHTFVVIVHIPPRADVEVASDVIHSTVAKLETQYPGVLLFISGDFSHVTLDKTQPAFSLYVGCNTSYRLYANVKDTYRAIPLPALGNRSQPYSASPSLQTKSEGATHNHMHMKWSPEAEPALRDCFGTKDWDHNGNIYNT